MSHNGKKDVTVTCEVRLDLGESLRTTNKTALAAVPGGEVPLKNTAGCYANAAWSGVLLGAL